MIRKRNEGAYLTSIHPHQCGGSCSCATCRCYVDDAWATKVGTPESDGERELLEGADETGPSARLSCQINMTPDLDGLIVRLPEKQV